MIAIENAKKKLKEEAETIKSPMTDMLCQQITDNITTYEIAEKILDEGKTLKGCKKAFDDFAGKNRKGSQSIIDPKTAQNLIEEYFDLKSIGAVEPKEENKIINILDLL